MTAQAAQDTSSTPKDDTRALLLRKLMHRMHLLMTAGLAITALGAMAVEYVYEAAVFFSSFAVQMLLMFSPMFFVFFKFTRARMAAMQARKILVAFFAFSLVLGVSCTFLFYNFESIDIGLGFSCTCAMFAAISVYGRLSRARLDGFNAFLLMAGAGACLSLAVNLFWLHDMTNFIVALVTQLFMTALCAWETQILREDVAERRMEDIAPLAAQRRMAAAGAMGVYMNIINMLGVFLFWGEASGKR